MTIHPEISKFTKNTIAQKHIQILRNLNAVFVSLPRIYCDHCNNEEENCEMSCPTKIIERQVDNYHEIITRVARVFREINFSQEHELTENKEIYTISKSYYNTVKRIQIIHGLKGVVKWAKGEI